MTSPSIKESDVALAIGAIFRDAEIDQELEGVYLCCGKACLVRQSRLEEIIAELATEVDRLNRQRQTVPPDTQKPVGSAST